MQTFVPYEDFESCAKCLDNLRLGKQRVEVLQICNALSQPDHGWQHHPATKMWRHYASILCDYGLAICAEWQRRGYADSCADLIYAKMQSRSWLHPQIDAKWPWWWGGPIHSTHRANLLRKRVEHYSQFDWPEFKTDFRNTPYFWPTPTEQA